MSVSASSPRSSTDTWSALSVAEHVDAAGELFSLHRGDQVNGLHKDLIEARAHTEAALALALANETASRVQ